MRKSLTFAGASLLVAALMLPGSPARAGEVSWDDPVDDAVAQGPASQATMDITKVNLSFDGKTFKTTMSIKQLGDPAPFGTGQYFAMRFTFGEGQYTMRLTQDRAAGNVFQFQERTETPGGSEVRTIPCRTCKSELDVAKSQVIMQIGMESLNSAIRKLGPGSTIETLSAESGSSYGLPDIGPFLWLDIGDNAPAPPPAKFTF